MSHEDKKFIELVQKSMHKNCDGHYEIDLPFKSEGFTLPNNYEVAHKRLMQLKNRFIRNPSLKNDYVQFMKEILGKYAELVPMEELNWTANLNFIPHSGVYHPKKPGKIRVVFDCSSTYNGVCLNDHLLTGPDFTNGILGILCRFRLVNIAFMCDVRGMFHQFVVPEKDKTYLRFLWWKDRASMREVVQDRMKVHLFGASSSPGCANYG